MGRADRDPRTGWRCSGWYGPTSRAFAALPPDGQAALERDLTALLEEGNTARDGTVAVPSTYLETVIVRE